MAEETFNESDVKTLRRLTSILNGGELTKKEFVEAFEQVVKIVLNIEKNIVGNNNTAQNALQETFDGLNTRTKRDIEVMKETGNNLIQNALKNLREFMDERLSKMEKKIGELRNGKDADEERMLNNLYAKIPTIEEIVKYLPQAGTAIRDSLELLQGKERLKISALAEGEELQKLIDEANKTKTPVTVRGGATRGFFVYIGGVKKGIIQTLDFVAGTNMAIAYSKVNGRDTITFTSSGGGGGSGVTVETPPEAVDPMGATVLFTVSARPKWVVSDGTTYYEGKGYTYNSGTGKITMDVGPTSFIRDIY